MTPEEERRLAAVEQQLAEVLARESELHVMVFKVLLLVDDVLNGEPKTAEERARRDAKMLGKAAGLLPFDDPEDEPEPPALRVIDGERKGARDRGNPGGDRHGLHSVG